jgi:hypothetical protein
MFSTNEFACIFASVTVSASANPNSRLTHGKEDSGTDK